MLQTWQINWRSGRPTADFAWPAFRALLFRTVQQMKRFVKIAFGFALVILGVVMILTPGPGWLTIVFGLGVLAAEFVWAKNLLDRLKEQGIRMRQLFLARLRVGRA
jgi:uncharacterized protein (TIGR02611 family)